MIHYFTIGLFLLFFIVFAKDRRKVLNGFLFSLAIFSTYLSISYEGLLHRQSIFFYLFIILSTLWVGVLLFGVFLLILFCFINAKIVFSKEQRTFQNSLTFAMGCLLVVLSIISLFNVKEILPEQLTFLVGFFRFSCVYFSFFFIEFSLSALLYQVYFPRYDKDYVIVLGSGLIDGHIVPPLLQERIMKALNFYKKQQLQGKKRAILIFSGGKGTDEQLSEAEAMYQFALSQGLPQEDALKEEQSTTTQENMAFSKQIMDDRSPEGYKVIFSTNSFHLLRAGIYAKRAHLKAQGIGAKTAFYFLPNAFIREFIAYLNLYRNYHLLILLFALLWTLLGEMIT